ncbi:hypothetical protein PAECIP111802_00230 [Paenibacillus allorhizosphaerae]|uniref:Uncharacterized protein n=1 Tax=Paenibacillus allorhizosphaerae TaxID=2849866 RepID=A0ABM8VAA3_9BACL|nr:hypothetical protein PAECIP111802_00230 [Paenibacillus allorhizosphaerae]
MKFHKYLEFAYHNALKYNPWDCTFFIPRTFRQTVDYKIHAWEN